MDIDLPLPSRSRRAVSGTNDLTGSHTQKRPREAQGADVADLDRAAQIARHRYRDGLEIRTLHDLETEHFRYVGKGVGDPGKVRKLTVDVTAISECARLYLEGEGDYWRHCEIKAGDFGDFVARVERSIKGYWGPALSPAR